MEYQGCLIPFRVEKRPRGITTCIRRRGSSCSHAPEPAPDSRTAPRISGKRSYLFQLTPPFACTSHMPTRLRKQLSLALMATTESLAPSTSRVWINVLLELTPQTNSFKRSETGPRDGLLSPSPTMDAMKISCGPRNNG
jgi:hypothetical protein